MVGKGQKAGKVALPPLARSALERYLIERQLPVSPERWEPTVALVPSLNADGTEKLSTVRLWAILRRFFRTTADTIEADNPAFAMKLRVAGPHWMRHTHATHALKRGAQLTSVRDNLRHAPFRPRPCTCIATRSSEPGSFGMLFRQVSPCQPDPNGTRRACHYRVTYTLGRTLQAAARFRLISFGRRPAASFSTLIAPRPALEAF
jgi:hypothetical protein